MALPRTLTLIASACALAVPATAGAAFPGTNGSIAFDRGGSVLTTPPVAGGAAATLSSTGYDFAPKVSPDGSKVAYYVNRDIWVMDADGSDQKQLTTNGLFNRDPDWSPDGRTIVYSGGGTASSRPDIFTIAVTGGTPKQITATEDHEEYEPAFSPDGTKIAYARSGCEIPYGGGSCVYVMSASGAGQTNLTPENEVPGCETQPGYYFNGASKSPSWSPDGTKIAFAGPLNCKVSSIGSDIWVMAANGAGKTNLTNDDGTNDVEPAFSPDGTQIAFARNSHSGPTSVFVLSSGGIAQVTNGTDDRNPDWGVAPKQCVVPKLKKQTLADARAHLQVMGCRVGDISKKQSKAAKGRVVRQSVKPDKRVRVGTKVDLVISK